MPTVSLYPTQSTYLRSGSYAYSNYGSVDRLRAGLGSNNTDGGYRTLIQFDLTSIPSNNITAATLYLYSVDDGAYRAGGTLNIYLNNQAWYQGVATFNSMAGNYYATPVSGTRWGGYDTWYSYDVTAHCQAIKAGTIVNNGFQVHQTSTTLELSKCFAKSGTYTPYLSVTYVGSNRNLTTVAGDYISSVTPSSVVEAGTQFTVTATPGSYPGYTTAFYRWTLSSGGYYTSNPLTLTMPDSDLTLTASAQRTPISYNFTVTSTGGYVINITKSPNTSTVAFGTSCIVSCGVSTLTGYLTTFTGWVSSDTALLPSSANSTYNFTMPAGNVTLTAGATRTPISYQLAFNANGGSGSMTNQVFAYDTAQTIKANTLTRTGYYLAGWATTPTGSVVYTNQQSVNNLTTVNNTVITLYAVWALQPYTLTLQANDVTYATVSYTPSGQYYYLNTLELTTALIPKTGYTLTFNNWTSNAGGTFANANALITNFTAPASNATVTANWTRTPNTYTLTFNYSVGSGSPASKSVTYDSAVGALPVAFEAGFTFLGWSTVEQVGYTARSIPVENVFDANTVYTTAGNQTIYAWYHEDIRVWTRSGGEGTTEEGTSRCLFEKASYTEGQWLFSGNWDPIDEQYEL